MKLHSFLVIENSGLGHVLCNSKVTVRAKNAVEAAKKATKCPIEMLAEADTSVKGVWEVTDIVSAVGWAGQTDPAHIKAMEDLVVKGHMRKRTFPGNLREVTFDPINQWLVTVIKR